jgi:hypothetical protein
MEQESSLVDPGHFGTTPDSIVIVKNFVDAADMKVVQDFFPMISEWENPMEDAFNEDGTCTYEASYWWDRMCSGRILERLNPDVFTIIDKYIVKMKNLLEGKFNVGLSTRPPVLVRWLPGNEQQPHADKQLNDGSPNPFPTYDVNSIIYWNEDFAGGEFYYPEHGIELKIEAGMAVAHPGDIHFLHGVKKVVSGTRWTTPSFYTVTELR